MSTRKLPKPNELVRVLLQSCDGRLEGRTALQKLSYFVSVETPCDVSFEPYFYGPFSRAIENSAEVLELRDEVVEVKTTIGLARSGWPIEQSVFSLTDQGKKEAEQDSNRFPELEAATSKVIKTVLNHVPNLSARPLSVAAKVHFILSNQDGPMSAEGIRDVAETMGWKLEDNSIDTAVELLTSLNLVSID